MNSELGTGKLRSRRRSSSVYGTDEEAEEQPKLTVLQTINDKIKAAMDYGTDRLKDRSQKFDDDVARKIPK